MAKNDIDDVLDHIRRIKSGGDVNRVNIDQIERLEVDLRFFRTFMKHHHVLLPDFLVKIIKKAKLIVKMLHWVFDGIPDERNTNLNLERLASQLLKFTEGNTSLIRYNYELNGSYVSEYMDCLGMNLNNVLMDLELEMSDPSLVNEEMFEINQFIKQVKIVLRKMRFLRYLYATEINGYVDHEKLECLEALIQFMANNVGLFCLAFSVSYLEFEDDTDEDEDDILNKPPYLLSLIVLVELEMKKIFLGELKASKFTQSRTFKDKKLPKGFSNHLHILQVYLRNKQLEDFPNN